MRSGGSTSEGFGEERPHYPVEDEIEAEEHLQLLITVVSGVGCCQRDGRQCRKQLRTPLTTTSTYFSPFPKPSSPAMLCEKLVVISVVVLPSTYQLDDM